MYIKEKITQEEEEEEEEEKERGIQIAKILV